MTHDQREEWIADQMMRLMVAANDANMDPIAYVMARISADVTAMRQMMEQSMDRRNNPKDEDEWKG